MAKSKEAKKASKPIPLKRGERLTSLLAGETVAKIRKEHGANTLVRASDYLVQRLPRIPSGIFDFDYGLGGGFPAGRISTLFGPKHAGKTSILLKAIAQAQHMCSNCYRYVDPEEGCGCDAYRDFVIAFLDVEGTLDLPWARRLGVDTDQLLLDVPEYAEQTLDIAEALVRTAEVDILVIDSLAFMTPRKEIEESADATLVGVQARKLGTGVRKFVSAVNGVGKEHGSRRRPTLFFTNQIRFKVGVMFGSPETQPGGVAPGFAASIEARIRQVKHEMDDASGKPIWAEVGYKFEKNKTAPSKMSGSFKLMVTDTKTRKAGHPYDELSMISWGEQNGIIVRKGGYKCLGQSFRIKADLENALAKDPGFKRGLRDALFEVMLEMEAEAE